MKTCKDCSQLKPKDSFSRYNPTIQKDGTVKYYYRPYCKPCNSRRGQAFKDARRETDPVYRAERGSSHNQNKRTYRQNPANRHKIIWQDTRKSDRKKGLGNDLTKEFIAEAISKPCRYCGETELKMTLDRIDNTQGHIMENVIEACIRCNLVRSDMPFEAWMTLVEGMKRARELGQFGNWTKELRR